MNLLMISGDRSVSSGKKGAFYYTLEELSKHFERIEIICPRVEIRSTLRQGSGQAPHEIRNKHEARNSNFEFVSDFGFRISDLPNVFFHSSPHRLWYQPFFILKKGKELLKSKKMPDWVMTVHDYPPFYNGIGARWLHRVTRTPYGVEVHHIVGYPTAASLQERIGRWMYHWPFFFKATVRAAAKVRTVNNEVEEKLMQWGIPQAKVEIVPSLYLDASALMPGPSIREEYDVVACARLTANKGLFEVLQAISSLKGVSLLLIGDGPERARLEDKARSLGIDDRVTFAGWLPEQRDVYREMQRGKIFLVNSRSEGNPRVAIEAMALGMPVVTTRVGIMPQFGEDGELVKFTDGSAKNLSEKLQVLLGDFSSTRAMGERARKEVLSRFAPGEAVQKYAEFLKNLSSPKKLSLLFITQKMHTQDAFVELWVRAFERKGYTVQVLCLENSRMSLRDMQHTSRSDVRQVFSMGKERRFGKIRQILSFYKYIFSLQYDRVFIHMSPVWYTLGFWWWLLKGIPVYLWYTHYKMQLGVFLFGLFGKRFFCATAQSLPQYEGSPKKIVTGHGIDLDFWKKRPSVTGNPHELLVVHRLSRSKRVEISLRALKLLPEIYTMVIYGIAAEPDYVAELRQLVSSLGLESRVTFHGTVPMEQLKEIYPQHRFILNMASETIDKTMLEAMTCGCYPVTTKKNAEAIGLLSAPDEDTPEAVAAFIQHFQGTNADELYRIVAECHSLEGMIAKMDEFIAKGL